MKSLKGHLLIASPELLSPFFTRSVTLMLEHTEQGAMGVTLNHPTDATVTDIAEEVFGEPFEWEKPIHLGGPVPGPLMILHTDAELADLEALPGVYGTIEAEKLREVLRTRPEPSLIIANNSGWGPGQLEGEFGDDSWLTLPATTEHVFWPGPADLWSVVVKGVNARKLSEFLGIDEVPPDPSLN